MVKVFLGMLTALLTPWLVDAEVRWETNSLRLVYESQGRFYCYAPTVVADGEREWMWACRNEHDGVIRDEIYFFEGNTHLLSAGTSVLKGSVAPGAWDGFHICDPSVIVGDFRVAGAKFRYAMVFLGNNVDASANNEIGMAFANEPGGPWMPDGEPIVAHRQNGFWGVGQPSLTRTRDGQYLLFYTKGDPGTDGFVRNIDFRHANRPRVGREIRLSKVGLTRRDGNPDYWSNFDMVYDPVRDWFWAIRDQHPFGRPTRIAAALQVLSLPAKEIFKRNARWTVQGTITPQITGFPRNHNACIVRTCDGTLPDANSIRICFTTACAPETCGGKDPLWTYSIREIGGSIARE
jgi:hypothetical protein